VEKDSIKDLKKGSIIAIILVIVAIIAIGTFGTFASIKVLKEKSGQKTEGKNFIETVKEYLGEKLGKKSEIGEKNLVEKSKEIIAKEAIIDACKKQSDTKGRDKCFMGVAMYYRDSSACNYINEPEDRKTCQKSIEEYNRAIEERDRELAKLSPEQRAQMEKIGSKEFQEMMEQFSKMMPNSPEEQAKMMQTEEYRNSLEQLYQTVIPGFKLQTPTTPGETESVGRGPGGGVTKDIYRISAEREKENEPYVKEAQALSDNVKVEYSALLQYATYLYGTEGMWSKNAKEVMDKLDKIEDENNISEGASQMIMTVVASDPALQQRVEERYNELLKQGL